MTLGDFMSCVYACWYVNEEGELDEKNSQWC